MVLGIDVEKEFEVGKLKDYLVTAYQEKKSGRTVARK